MKPTILVCAFLVVTAAGLGAQEASQSSPYRGTSNPPPDDTITIPDTQPVPAPKPSPSQPASALSTAQAQPQSYAQPNPQDARQPSPSHPQGGYSAPEPGDGTDDGIVQIAPDNAGQPALNQRPYINDPDGDIVHPAPLGPGMLGEGTTIRVRLLDRLSTAESRAGDRFHTLVATDVVQNGQVLIPAGSHIEGIVASVSTGHAGGHGSMHLRPETVILSDGSRFHLYAQVSGTPDSRTHVRGEGAITPGSRLEKDGIEYGGAVAAGAITGGILGGPGGALAGTIVGAGVITVHLLVSHPQATLDNGSVLIFTLNEPLNLVPATQTGN
jgi:hypothetical protein